MSYEEDTAKVSTGKRHWWHSLRRYILMVLPHSINAILSLYVLLIIGLKGYLDDEQVWVYAPVNMLVMTVFIGLYFLIMLVLGIRLQNVWARRVCRYLALPILIIVYTIAEAFNNY